MIETRLRARRATSRHAAALLVTSRPKPIKSIGRRAHLHYCGQCGRRHKDCRCQERAA